MKRGPEVNHMLNNPDMVRCTKEICNPIIAKPSPNSVGGRSRAEGGGSAAAASATACGSTTHTKMGYT